MDLSLSDFDLVVFFCDKYNLDAHNGGNTDYCAWASSIRYVFEITSKKEQRDYVKRLKYANSKLTKPALFNRLMLRLCKSSNKAAMKYDDLCETQRKVKLKLGVSHCSHSCYDFIRNFGFVFVECDCCGVEFLSAYNNESKLEQCSFECSSISRLYNNLLDLSLHKKISQRFIRSKEESKLHTFLNYLAKQQQIKRTKKAKGKFTWG